MRAMSISVLVKKRFVETGRQMYNNLKKHSRRLYQNKIWEEEVSK